MDAINVKKFGLAVGLTLFIFRLGCIIIFSVTSREQAIEFSNILLHGVDVTPILQAGMSIQKMIYGLIQIFIFGWLAGASIASIYNFQCRHCGCKA